MFENLNVLTNFALYFEQFCFLWPEYEVPYIRRVSGEPCCWNMPRALTQDTLLDRWIEDTKEYNDLDLFLEGVRKLTKTQLLCGSSVVGVGWPFFDNSAQ